MSRTKAGQAASSSRISSEVTIRVSGLEEELPVVFRQDGTGCLEPEYNWDKFTHDLDLFALQTQFSDRAKLEEYLVNYFWQKVDDRLEDPLWRDYSELEGHELEFVAGKAEELDHLMQLFLLTEPGLENAGEDSVVIRCGYEDKEPRLEDEWSYFSDRLARLTRLAFKEHQPYGYQYEYNDERGDRRSGYSLTPACLNYELDEYLTAPAREKMSARSKLRGWLLARGKDPAEFDLEVWEKIL